MNEIELCACQISIVSTPFYVYLYFHWSYFSKKYIVMVFHGLE